jgi:hypothetical protein
MAYRYGEARYSQYRYSWITEWARQECFGVVPVAASFTAQAMPMGMTTYVSGNTAPTIVQANSGWPGNQQQLGVRPQPQLRQVGHLGRAVAR